MQKIFTSLVLCITLAFNASAQHSAGKTTVGGSRWYSYGQYLDTALRYGISGSVIDTAPVFMWQDSAGYVIYTSGPAKAGFMSVGAFFHPQAPGFNDSVFYGGEILLDSTRAYTIDSVRVFGYYRFNPAKASVVDTLVLSIITGAGLPDTTIGVPAYSYPLLSCDVSTGVAAASTIPAPVVYRNVLTSANWGDTTTNGVFSSLFTFSTPLSVPVSGQAIATIGFRSGDPARPVPPSWDTISPTGGHYEYNAFFPASAFVRNTAYDIVYAPYIPYDHNESIYAVIQNPGRYYATRALSAGGNAHQFQQVLLQWHVNCPSCPLIPRADASINNVTASFANIYPSPASDILYVETNTNGAQLVLTDILGHALLTQTLTGNTAAINIAALPSGIYIYTLRSGSNIATGRVSIVH